MHSFLLFLGKTVPPWWTCLDHCWWRLSACRAPLDCCTNYTVHCSTHEDEKWCQQTQNWWEIVDSKLDFSFLSFVLLCPIDALAMLYLLMDVLLKHFQCLFLISIHDWCSSMGLMLLCLPLSMSCQRSHSASDPSQRGSPRWLHVGFGQIFWSWSNAAASNLAEEPSCSAFFHSARRLLQNLLHTNSENSGCCMHTTLGTISAEVSGTLPRIRSSSRSSFALLFLHDDSLFFFDFPASLFLLLVLVETIMCLMKMVKMVTLKRAQLNWVAQLIERHWLLNELNQPIWNGLFAGRWPVHCQCRVVHAVHVSRCLLWLPSDAFGLFRGSSSAHLRLPRDNWVQTLSIPFVSFSTACCSCLAKNHKTTLPQFNTIRLIPSIPFTPTKEVFLNTPTSNFCSTLKTVQVEFKILHSKSFLKISLMTLEQTTWRERRNCETDWATWKTWTKKSTALSQQFWAFCHCTHSSQHHLQVSTLLHQKNQWRVHLVFPMKKSNLPSSRNLLLNLVSMPCHCKNPVSCCAWASVFVVFEQTWLILGNFISFSQATKSSNSTLETPKTTREIFFQCSDSWLRFLAWLELPTAWLSAARPSICVMLTSWKPSWRKMATELPFQSHRFQNIWLTNARSFLLWKMKRTSAERPRKRMTWQPRISRKRNICRWKKWRACFPAMQFACPSIKRTWQQSWRRPRACWRCN